MTKQDELCYPGSCFNKALPDEYMFVLLARDAAAPAVIRSWVAERVRLGMNGLGDYQVVEALQLAKDMEEQYTVLRVR